MNVSNILNGKLVSEEIFEEISKKIKKQSIMPKLVIILVGDNSASQTYVNNKIMACEKVGIDHKVLKLENSVHENRLLGLIEKINADNSVHGLIVQLPLPSHIDTNHVINSINPKKDVDGLHPLNFGKMALGLKCHMPATPSGILKLIEKYNITTKGKNCTIIGRSRIVGSPLSILLSRNSKLGNCTVTLCHSQTQNLEESTQKADILISAIGIPNFIKANMVKEGVVVIDVGMNRIEDNTKTKGYRLVGDVDFKEVSKKSSYITPVPGGVGPMTIASLVSNTFDAYFLINGSI